MVDKWIECKDKPPEKSITAVWVYDTETCISQAHYLGHFGDERDGWHIYDTHGWPVRWDVIWEDKEITHYWSKPIHEYEPNPPGEIANAETA